MTQAITMIDDNPLDHLIVERLCQRDCADAELYFCSDAALILSNLRCGEKRFPRYPDIILLDLNMPGTSGWEFLKELKGFYSELAKPVDVYVMSSSIDPADREYAMAYPFVKDYFIKPMTSSVLKKMQRHYS